MKKHTITPSTKPNYILYEGEEYNISLLSDVQLLHAKLSPKLNMLCSGEKPYHRYTPIEKLDVREYESVTVGTEYKVSRKIIPLSDLDNPLFHKVIVKVGFYEIFIDPKNDKSETCFVHFIYGKDKKTNLEARGLDLNIVDRLDRFKGAREKKSTGPFKGKYIIRHTGTHEGAIKRSNARRAENRSDNMEFLRVLMNGPNKVSRALHCPKFGNNVEFYNTIFNAITGEYRDIAFFEIHHAKFINGESTHKNGKDPSNAINRTNYKNMSADVINEFLHCIVLSNNYHSMIHKSHRHDDIQGWYGRLKRGEIGFIPYHWISKSKYEKTIKWILDNVDGYTEEDIIPWEDFVSMNSFSEEEKNRILNDLPKETRSNANFIHIEDHDEID